MTSAPGRPGRDSADEEPDHAGTDDEDPIARPGARIPDRVQRRFHVGGERRPPRRHGRRHEGEAPGRRREAILMRVEREHRPADEVARTFLDSPDGAVAVLDREGEIPLLHRRPHPFALDGGDPALEDEALGAAAERAPGGADERIGRRRGAERGAAQLCAAAADIPERPRELLRSTARFVHQSFSLAALKRQLRGFSG